MKLAKSGILIVGASFILLLGSSAVMADMASGTYNTDLSDVAPVWDISGNYQMNFDYSDYESCSMTFTITQSTSGELSGSGSYHYAFDYYGEALYIDGALTAGGLVKTTGGSPVCLMNFKVTGSGYVEEDYYTVDLLFAETVNFNFILDTNNNQLVTEGAIGKAKFFLPDYNKHFNDRQYFWETQIPLADKASSGWALSLDLRPNKSRYDGTATVLTQSGQSVSFALKGAYSPVKDTSTLTLTGGKSGNLNLVTATAGPNITVLSVKGKLFGQNIIYQKP